MKDPVLLLWFIPGYIALQLYRQVNPVRSKQGWEWIFQTAFAAFDKELHERFISQGSTVIKF